MTYSFSEATHDRAAHLRANDHWRDELDDLRVLVLGGEHVATNGIGNIRWLTVDEAPDGEWVFLGHRDGVRYAAVIVDRVATELEPQSLRAVAPALSDVDASLAVHSVGVARWHHMHRFCAQCGQPTRSTMAGHQRVCDACGASHFPRIDPAVIMLVTDDQDRALLGHQEVWPAGRFSTLAGFVEPGETLEDAVRREVAEETSIAVGEITYAGSQPWPFPASVMVGFFVRALDSGIEVDGTEIAEARWFSRAEVTELTQAGDLLLPSTASISRMLIDRWHGGVIYGAWS